MSVDRLTEALADYDSTRWRSEVSWDQQALVDAARRWVTPPSEQAIEAAAQAAYEVTLKGIARGKRWETIARAAVEAYRVAENGEET